MTGFVEKKDERESFDAMLRRFTRNVISSQTMVEAKTRRFFAKPTNKRAKKLSALNRLRILKSKAKELY